MLKGTVDQYLLYEKQDHTQIVGYCMRTNIIPKLLGIAV